MDSLDSSLLSQLLQEGSSVRGRSLNRGRHNEPIRQQILSKGRRVQSSVKYVELDPLHTNFWLLRMVHG